MKICFDCDGVILDFKEGFVNWIIKTYPDVDIDVSSYNILKNANFTKKEEREILNNFFETPEFRDIEYFNNVGNVLKKLRKDGHTVHIITALNPRYTQLRKNQLEKIDYDEMKLMGGRKEKYIINTVKPDLMVEDKPDLIKSFQESGITTFYPSASYIPFRDENCYFDWFDLYNKIKNYEKRQT